MLPQNSQDILHLVEKYLELFPTEKNRVRELEEACAIDLPVWQTTCKHGHLTASAFVVNTLANKVVLIHHNKLQLWLQPGGHLENNDQSLWQAAQREAEEETGLRQLMLIPINRQHLEVPIDLDIHAIPNDPQRGHARHYHFDFRYVFQILEDQPFSHQEGEVSNIVWEHLDTQQKGDASFQFGLEKVRKLLLDTTYPTKSN